MPHQQRTSVLTLRLSPEEREAIQKAAAQSGSSVSDFLRDRATGVTRSSAPTGGMSGDTPSDATNRAVHTGNMSASGVGGAAWVQGVSGHSTNLQTITLITG